MYLYALKKSVTIDNSLVVKKSLKIPGSVVNDAEEWNFVSRDWISKDSDLSLTDYYASGELLDM